MRTGIVNSISTKLRSLKVSQLNKRVQISPHMNIKTYALLKEAQSTIGNYAKHNNLKVKFEPAEAGFKMTVDKTCIIPNNLNTDVWGVAKYSVEKNVTKAPSDRRDFLRSVYTKLANMNTEAKEAHSEYLATPKVISPGQHLLNPFGV